MAKFPLRESEQVCGCFDQVWPISNGNSAAWTELDESRSCCIGICASTGPFKSLVKNYFDQALAALAWASFAKTCCFIFLVLPWGIAFVVRPVVGRTIATKITAKTNRQTMNKDEHNKNAQHRRHTSTSQKLRNFGKHIKHDMKMHLWLNVLSLFQVFSFGFAFPWIFLRFSCVLENAFAIHLTIVWKFHSLSGNLPSACELGRAGKNEWTRGGRVWEMKQKFAVKQENW